MHANIVDASRWKRDESTTRRSLSHRAVRSFFKKKKEKKKLHTILLLLKVERVNTIDARRITSVTSLRLVDRCLVIQLVPSIDQPRSRGNHLPLPESTSFPRNYTMFAADAPMHR